MKRLLIGLLCASICAYSQSTNSVCRLARLTNEEWQKVHSGEIVVKVLDTSYKREVAVAGVARVRVSRACFLDQFRDIENFKKSPAVRQIGKLQKPIRRDALSAMTLEQQDLDALRQCKIGSCAVKVPVTVLQRLAQNRQVLKESLGPVANPIFREELTNYVRNYVSLGDQELIQYRDKNKPVSLREQFYSLLEGWQQVNALAPELCGFITRGPEQPLAFLDEFLYWSKESFGLKPVISVTHVTIYQLPDQVWIASKQIYASHYFDASLAITLVTDDLEDTSGGTIYLVYVNRSRIDLLGGIFAGLCEA